jgi:hypothetical protein
MIEDGGVYNDRWGQAKYAMEVFALMLEEKDAMRVYYMSDFIPQIGGSINAPPKITISGAEPAGVRVEKIRKTVTYAHGTPFDPVIKAYADLRNSDAEEKWLVILTDGEFNRLYGQSVSSVNVNDFFSQYVNESNVRIILLAMGEDAEVIRAEPNRGIFFEHAKNNNEILGKITAICNRIFNRNKLNFTNVTRREFSVDIPMLEFFVFAQGAEVKVNGIKGDGTHSPNEVVNVRYSEEAATNYRGNSNVIISRSLTGVVATFRNLPKGKYSLDITGAQTVEVYYKPDVKIDIRLYQWGREIHMKDYPEGIPEGRYRIRYGLVDPEGKFITSSLLGNVEYEAAVQNGGLTIPIKSSDIINFIDGELIINVTARFLDINTAVDSLSGKVLPFSFIKRLYNFIKENWLLLTILLGIFLFWLMYFPLKKKFPKMAKKPIIKVKFNGEEQSGDYGKFKIKRKMLPLLAEVGYIRVVPQNKFLSELKVKAKNKSDMILLNADKFSQETLKSDGIRFRLNNSTTIRHEIGRKMEIPCLSKITTIYPGREGSPEEEYNCFLEEGRK